MALNPEHHWLLSKKVFQERVQQYQNNLQAGFPLWHLNPTGELESGLHMRKRGACRMKPHVSCLKLLRNEAVGLETVPQTERVERDETGKKSWMRL